MAKVGSGIFTECGNDNIEVLLRKFKSKVKKCGLMEEIMDRKEYTKPSVKKRKKRLKSIIEQKRESNRMKD